MTKRDQRQVILQRLKKHDFLEKQAADGRLLARILATSTYQKANVLATYLSLDHEFATGPLLEQALTDGKLVLVPKVLGPGQMVFMPYQAGNLVQSVFGVWEPKSGLIVAKEEIDLIHVPGLVFNREGFRIGYGGGFYDRYLADYEGHTLASLYGFQLQDFEPDTHDRAVKELLIDEERI